MTEKQKARLLIERLMECGMSTDNIKSIPPAKMRLVTKGKACFWLFKLPDLCSCCGKPKLSVSIAPRLPAEQIEWMQKKA